MRHFLLPAGVCGEGSLTLSGKAFHYLCRVLRLGEGDTISAVDGYGTAYILRIVTVGRDTATVEVRKREAFPEKEVLISLYQCLPKGRKMDLIVRQAVEAGIYRIVPVISRYSVPRLEDNEKKLSRWRRIAGEALQQSGSTWLPLIGEPVHLCDLIRDDLGGLSLFFHQEPLGSESLHDLLAEIPSKINILIGPEGGLSKEEVTLLLDRGFSPVFIANTVLRTETAAVYALGAVNIILQERDRWRIRQRPSNA